MPGNLMFILWRLLGFGDDRQLYDRVVRLETKAETTDSDVRTLFGKVDDLTRRVDENGEQTRRELSAHIRVLSEQVGEFRGGIKLANWIAVTSIVLVTGLLGWGQIGDAAWSACRHLFGYS